MSSTRSSVILGSLVLVGSAAVYPWLPAEVPIHFDALGRVDGTAPKAVGAFLLPAIALLLVAAGTLFMRRRAERERGAIAATLLLTTGLLAGLQVIVLRAAMLGVTDVSLALGTLLAVFSLALALLLPRLRRNWFIGIRTPWSLASDETWARAHRVGGYLFAAAGVVGVVGVALGLPALALVAIIVASIGSIAGSWWVSR